MLCLLVVYGAKRPTSLLSTFQRYFVSKCFQNSDSQEELYSNLLRKCTKTSGLPSGRAIHAILVKGFLPFSLFICNHILNMYVKCGDIVSGYKVFDEIPERNVVSWSAIIAGCVQHDCPIEALSLFRRMIRHGTSRPNEFTLVSTLQACSLCDDLTHAFQVYAFVVRLGFQSNIFLTNAFLTSLIRHSKLLDAVEVFDKCSDKDIVSWNAMMAGYLQYSYMDVPAFWYRMTREGVEPDNFTFATVLTGLAALSDMKMGLQVHAHLIKSGHGAELCVANSLADMYLKNQRLEEGFKIFSEMPQKDVCSWTQMATSCLQCGEPSKALVIFGDMKQQGVTPNKFTLATALNACANLASLEEGKKVHGLRIKLGTEMDVCVDNALLDMYAKCGCMDGARGVFQTMNHRSVITWTTMIMACAQNGQAREALEVFDEMRLEGAEPNYITFISVLYACSQGGFISEGWRYFSSMSCDHGITPREDHYACMVNLLGRAGYTREAEELILRMPFQPGRLVWQTLLAACQVQGDVETGKRAAEHAIDLDQKDSPSYVLLSNIFAGLDNWNTVEMLRGLMDSRNVKKTPGSSWIATEKD